MHLIYTQFKKYKANIYVTITQVKEESEVMSLQEPSLSCFLSLPGNPSPDFQDERVPCFATSICIPLELYKNGNTLRTLFGSLLLAFNITVVRLICVAECSFNLFICIAVLCSAVELDPPPSYYLWPWTCFQFRIITNIYADLCRIIVGYMPLFYIIANFLPICFSYLQPSSLRIRSCLQHSQLFPLRAQHKIVFAESIS